MADDDRTAAPARKQVDHRLAALPVEIVGRLVEQQEIGLREDERGESRARALPARQRGQRRVRLRIEAHLGESRGHAGLQRPIGVGQLLGRGFAGLGAAQHHQRIDDAEQGGDGLLRVDLDDLAQESQPSVEGDAAGMGLQLAGDQLEKRGLADAVTADEPGPFRAEIQVEIGEKRAALRRGP